MNLHLVKINSLLLLQYTETLLPAASLFTLALFHFLLREMNPTSDSGEREFLNIISTQALNRLASYMTSDSAVSREYHPCYTYLKYQFNPLGFTSPFNSS